LRVPKTSSALFDAILTDAGIEVVLTGVQMPRMNSIMERWIQSCRHEVLDRSLIWNQRIYCTLCASTNATTINIGHTAASPTPDPCEHYPTR
jgi:hypothetical protein